MKNVLNKTIAGLALALVAGSVAFANPILINGGITFGNGDLSFTNIEPTSADVSFLDGSVGGATGVFHPFAHTTIASLTFATILLTGPTGFPDYTGVVLPSGPLWQFVSGGLDYTFYATTISITPQGPGPDNTSWNLAGNGFFAIDGGAYLSTAGTWHLTLSADGTGDNAVTSFESTASSSGLGVPDGGTTALLVGLSLVGLGVFARRSRLAKA